MAIQSNANSTLNVVSLDRPTLRADLIAFLKGQSQFRDYDFTGSNLSVLIDLLAYNTNKQAFLTNMLFAEAFLDSAQLMSSVISHAKELNYLPRSAKSASAEISVRFSASGDNQPYVIPKGSSFSTLIKNSQYVFTTAETIVCASSNTSFGFDTTIYEGEYFKDGYVYSPTVDDPYPSFKVTNKNVDTESLSVVVFTDDASQGVTYTLATSLLDLNDRSLVYFLQGTPDGHYEVLFGDGVVGAQPPSGSSVVLDYRVTVGDRANSATKFAINFDPTGTFSEADLVKVYTNSNSQGGAPAESLGSIKYYAPRWYQTQERATAAPDYVTLLRVKFPEILAVAAYGGEDAIPPLYGRIVVSVAVAGLEKLPNSKKAQYTKFLEGRMPLGMRPVFIDPFFTYVRVDSVVKYDVNVTSNSKTRIQSLVLDAITAWSAEYLGDFSSTLYYSPFCSAIDRADPSIVSNTTRLLLYKKLVPAVFGVEQAYTLDFQTSLVSDFSAAYYPHPSTDERAIYSTVFSYRGTDVRLEDNGRGILNLVVDQNASTSLVGPCGTVDYAAGTITIASLAIDGFQGNTINVYARSATADLSSQKNTILIIEPPGVNLIIAPVSP